jgi:hypothetical protein
VTGDIQNDSGGECDQQEVVVRANPAISRRWAAQVVVAVVADVIAWTIVPVTACPGTMVIVAVDHDMAAVVIVAMGIVTVVMRALVVAAFIVMAIVAMVMMITAVVAMVMMVVLILPDGSRGSQRKAATG